MKQNSYALITTVLALMLSLGAAAQYCTPNADCSFGDGVTQMTIGPFTNLSACEADMGIEGYADFTDLTGLELGQGVTYEAQFLSGFGNQQFSIWIDANQNTLFETEELIMTDLEVGTAIVATNITIPMDLALGTYRLRIKAVWNGPSSLDACATGGFGETEDYVITVTEPPSCFNVSGIEMTAIGAYEASVTWTDPGTASVWDIEWGPAGFMPTGTPSAGFDNVVMPATFTGLDPVSTYDVYIRADCGEDNVTDVSVWSSAFSFTSACGAIIPAYHADFADGLPDCWETSSEGDIITGPIDTDFANWGVDGFANVPGQFGNCQGVGMFNANDDQWLISPDFDLSSAVNQQLEFDIAVTESFDQGIGPLSEGDEIRLMVTEDFGVNWSTMALWDSTEAISNSGEHLIYDLSIYEGGTVRFAVYAHTGPEDDFDNWDLFIDNFRIQDLGAPADIFIESIAEPTCGFFGNTLADVYVSTYGGVMPYSYLWSDGSDTEDLIDAEAGTYTLTLTDATGTEYQSEPILVPGTPSVSVTATVTDESIDGMADGSIVIDEVIGGEGPYTYFWNNGSTESEINGLIDAYWCVNVEDNNGCLTDTCFEVLQGEIVDGLAELSAELGLSVYPNPSTSGIYQISADLGMGALWQLSIVDATGRLVALQELNAQGIYQEEIDLSNVQSGVYTLRLMRRSDGAHAIRVLLR